MNSLPFYLCSESFVLLYKTQADCGLTCIPLRGSFASNQYLRLNAPVHIMCLTTVVGNVAVLAWLQVPVLIEMGFLQLYNETQTSDNE